jgi:hypothetical protein
MVQLLDNFMVMMMKEEEEVSQHTLIYLLPQLK